MGHWADDATIARLLYEDQLAAARQRRGYGIDLIEEVRTDTHTCALTPPPPPPPRG
jgi:hypothetical protein